MGSRENNSLYVTEHHERRLARGELQRKFYVREEHMETLRLFMIENGLTNQNSAIQAVLEKIRSDLPSHRPRPTTGRNDNSTEKDRA